MVNDWYKLKVDVPPGEYGDIEIEQKTISKENSRMHQIQAMMGGHGRFTPPGTYTGLRRNGKLWMSDAPDEVRDQIPFVGNATGHVLIVGLGIGLAVEACLRKPEVETITVVEIDPDVAAYVGKHYKEKASKEDKLLNIINSDFWEWDPSPYAPFDLAWVDIWPTLNVDDLQEHTKARRKLRKHMTNMKADDVMCWARDFLIRKRKEDQRQPYWGW